MRDRVGALLASVVLAGIAGLVVGWTVSQVARLALRRLRRRGV